MMTVRPPASSSALLLSGSAYVSLGSPSILASLPSYTLEAWVYPTSTTGSQAVIGGQYPLYLVNGVPTAGYPSSATPLQAPSALAVNQWYYLAASFNAATGKLSLYVNSAQVAQATYTPSTATSTANVLIGAVMASGTPEWFLQGMIGRTLIWSSCRTSDEILNDSVVMEAIEEAAEPTLVSYLDFSNMPVVDLSGYNTGLSFKGGATYSLSNPGLTFASSGYVDCGSMPVLDLEGNLPYTIEGWFQASGSGVIISKYQTPVGSAQPICQYQVSYQKSQVTSYRGLQQVASNGMLRVGNFYHFATSYDSETSLLSLYINGNLQAAEQFLPAADLPSAAELSLLIGANQTTSGAVGNFFKGQIQNLRIWNVCLVQADIRQWMYNDPINSPNLLANFDFTVSPPLDTTQQNFLQLEGGAAWTVTQTTIGPTSDEGSIGILQTVNSEYLSTADDLPLVETPMVLSVAEQPAPFSDAHREASWQSLVAAASLPEDAALLASLRQRFEEGYREASARVAADPSLLNPFTQVIEGGMLKIIYHGPHGDSVALVIPAGSASDCDLWWLIFVYTLTAGFLQALGLIPSNFAVAKQIFNLVKQNPAAMAAIRTVLGKTVTATTGLSLVGVLYSQGLLWPILKFLLASAGWWALGRALAQAIAVLTGVEAAVILSGFIIWGVQLTYQTTKYKAACSFAFGEAAPTPELALA